MPKKKRIKSIDPIPDHFIHALICVKNGADVTGYELAKTLRKIQSIYKEPELVTITSVMGRYDVKEKLPYFGAICTTAGKEAIKVHNRRLRSIHLSPSVPSVGK